MRPPFRRFVAASCLALVGVIVVGCGGPEVAQPTPGPTRTPPPFLAEPSPSPVLRPGETTVDTPPVIDHGPREGNSVALTFDADMTPGMLTLLDTHSFANLKVIETLERERVPATFFLTGLWVQAYPEVTRRLADNPLFELANHTWTHSAFTADCYDLPVVATDEMASEITRTFEIIKPYGGFQTHYFRFPGLCLDDDALAAIAPTHVTVIQGDVISGDPGATASEPIVHAVLSRVRPGSIVILHITEDNAAFTDEALPHILDGLREKGLEPVGLAELLLPATPTP